MQFCKVKNQKDSCQSMKDLHYSQTQNHQKTVKFIRNSPRTLQNEQGKNLSANEQFKGQLIGQGYIRMKEKQSLGSLKTSQSEQEIRIQKSKKENKRSRREFLKKEDLQLLKQKQQVKSLKLLQNSHKVQKTSKTNENQIELKIKLNEKTRRISRSTHKKKDFIRQNLDGQSEDLRKQIKIKDQEIARLKKKLNEKDLELADLRIKRQKQNKETQRKMLQLQKSLEEYNTENQKLTNQIQEFIMESQLISQKSVNTYVQEESSQSGISALKEFENTEVFLEKEVQKRDGEIYYLRKKIEGFLLKETFRQKRYNEQSSRIASLMNQKYYTLAQKYKNLYRKVSQRECSSYRQARLSLSPQ